MRRTRRSATRRQVRGLGSDPSDNASHYILVPMRSRVLWRRSATALGVYVATVLGFLTTVVATRELGVARLRALRRDRRRDGLLPDAARPDGRGGAGQVRLPLRRGASTGGGCGGCSRSRSRSSSRAACSPGSCSSRWRRSRRSLRRRRRARADADRRRCCPSLQAPEGVAGGALILRGRYDVRGGVPRVLDGAAPRRARASARRYGVDGAVIGLVVAQVVATAAICAVGLAAFRRFPQRAARAARRATAARSARSWSPSTLAPGARLARARRSAPSLVPAVAPIAQAGYFRDAQAPPTGFAALSAPARLVLLTEQTRDFEAGRHDRDATRAAPLHRSARPR